MGAMLGFFMHMVAYDMEDRWCFAAEWSKDTLMLLWAVLFFTKNSVDVQNIHTG